MKETIINLEYIEDILKSFKKVSKVIHLIDDNKITEKESPGFKKLTEDVVKRLNENHRMSKKEA